VDRAGVRPSSGPDSVEARILEVARAHIRRFGVARATIVGVAHDAGMTHANVYRYFPSKATLFEEITASWLRPIETRLREVADGPAPAVTTTTRPALSAPARPWT